MWQIKAIKNRTSRWGGWSWKVSCLYPCKKQEWGFWPIIVIDRKLCYKWHRTQVERSFVAFPTSQNEPASVLRTLPVSIVISHCQVRWPVRVIWLRWPSVKTPQPPRCSSEKYCISHSPKLKHTYNHTHNFRKTDVPHESWCTILTCTQLRKFPCGETAQPEGPGDITKVSCSFSVMPCSSKTQSSLRASKPCRSLNPEPVLKSTLD